MSKEFKDIELASFLKRKKLSHEILITLSLVLESMAEGVNVSNNRGIILFANPAFDAMFGYSQDELTGKHIFKLTTYSSEEYEQIYREINQILDTQKVWTGEFSNKNKYGKVFYTEARISALEIRGKRYMISVQNDITERKLMEATLRKSESKYRIVSDNTYDMGYWISPEKKFLYMSPSCELITGYNADEFLEDRNLIYRIIHSEDQPQFANHMVLVENKLHCDEIEFRIIRKDGTIRWVGHVCRPVIDNDGNFLGTRASNRDITKRKETEQKFNQLTDELKQSNLELQSKLAELNKEIKVRERMQEALELSEERYRQLIEAVTSYTYSVQVNRGQEIYNEHSIGCLPITGYSPDDFKANLHLWQSIVYPDDKFMVENSIKEILAGKKVLPIEYRIIPRDRTAIWIRNTMAPYYNDRGELIRYDCLVVDITERKSMENGLRKSEEKYRMVADSTYDWETWIDASGKYEYVSPSCELITGYQPDEFLSDPSLVVKITHPDDRDSVEKHSQEILDHRISTDHLDFRIITRSGEIRWISHYCQPVYNKEGVYFGRRGSNRDITTRKYTEYMLQDADITYKRLVGAINAYTYSVEVKDGNTVETHRSIGCIPITGYRPEDYESDPDLWYKMIYSDDRPKVENALKDVLSGKDIPPIEHRLIRADGEMIWVRNTIVPFYDEYRRLIRYDGMIEDITKRKDFEEQILRLNNDLEQKVMDIEEANKELDAFNRSVSHDLQTPTTIIGGFARRLLKICSDKIGTDEINMLTTIQMSAQSMERIIKDLLAFSRSARQEIESAEINMENLVRTVFDELNVLTEGRIIRLDMQVLPPACGDMGLLKQVVTNLLSNAIKFTYSRDMPIITVGCKIDNNENIYYVKDNGIGFDMQHINTLFAPFNRLPEAKEIDGTGIGLSIVERIINRHGGRVWAEGKINEGATFYFSLPNKKA